MNDYCYFNGVAQGSPLSPTLATLVLIPTLMIDQNIKVVFYADDGILYSNKKFDPSLLLDNLSSKSGITVHDEGPKRSWIKYDNQ